MKTIIQTFVCVLSLGACACALEGDEGGKEKLFVSGTPLSEFPQPTKQEVRMTRDGRVLWPGDAGYEEGLTIAEMKAAGATRRTEPGKGTEPEKGTETPKRLYNLSFAEDDLLCMPEGGLGDDEWEEEEKREENSSSLIRKGFRPSIEPERGSGLTIPDQEELKYDPAHGLYRQELKDDPKRNMSYYGASIDELSSEPAAIPAKVTKHSVVFDLQAESSESDKE